ncbi:putative baseplate assembly protein [Mycolicibacterium monacense]|uniref:Baseplate assembly protein n=2 Tax=Mycobacteriaceae TaxID=1762 RepID=A0AAD1N114_MYCMB|nr:putative baseplate assembly protein [Mycolicibacterium monacense]MDA4100481.1 baseplate J family protein [Mycolicibacterium monacense DSM 44395]OBB62090.1 putative baseplate assembly protein [Mycolicibacterium monacense]OBF54909.1 putative baseplate assembly protein [Mycolicibacterium monacense]ORB21423.1 putative baseplate assembly protein [Mycolicibacterium monacense DSM 44395]QHP84742.1 putative baseplate assembly protein [Mycolicibacterium monacense DSM 44395]
MLPAPRLDDRGFQDLVDDARRRIRRTCPTWSEHNISDPGITLVETFAMMLDQLIYRLNRVPDRHYVKFLELLGLELRPPGAAQGEVTFWLSAPQPQTIRVREGIEVSTDRTDLEEPVVFSTAEPLDIVPCTLQSGQVATVSAGGIPVDRSNPTTGAGFPCFSAMPTPGDALLIGLDKAVPRCAVLLRIVCQVSGVGVDPTDPPYVWEAWTEPGGWKPCEVDRDETKAFNQPGDVILHVPKGHTLASPETLAGTRRGWLRCRLLEPSPGQDTYSESPLINSITAATKGGTIPIVHARVIRDEVVGVSDGTPAQRLPLKNRPVLPWAGTTLSVVRDGAATEWHPVENFAFEKQDSQSFHIDAVDGEVVFGPAVREADGSLTQYGRIPPKGATLKMTAYRTGGGPAGNVRKGAIHVLKTSVPYVSRVENRRAAAGGAPAETIEDAKTRGPLLIRSRGRAVTAEDFEELAREAAPGIARVHCLTPSSPAEAGLIRLLVVPNVSSDALGAVRREDLDLSDDTKARIKAYLDERKLAGTHVRVKAPAYQGLTIVATLAALPGYRRDHLRDDVLRALNRLLHPLTGGPDGTGWPIGRPVQRHELAAALAWTPGVDMSREVVLDLYPADTTTGARGDRVDKLLLNPDALVLSHRHKVQVS